MIDLDQNGQPVKATPLPRLSAFKGLAGSPLSSVTDPGEIKQQVARRGRPRRHANDLAKTAAYRARKKDAATRAANAAAIDAVLNAPERYQRESTGGRSIQALVNIDAGYQKSEEYHTEQSEEFHGRRVVPRGASCDPEDKGTPADRFERDETFVAKQERRGAFDKTPKPQSRGKLLRSRAKLFCTAHSAVSGVTDV